jgi:DNA-binding transcriptional LysR family regulator
MSLNLHLLRLFTVVARHGSFSRAAEALHISQPAISKGVREFELQVGERLLERGRAGIRPTTAGQALLRHASALFAAERAAEEELAAMRGLTRGSLSIGASTTIGTYLLPPLLGAFHRAHPGIDLRLRNANTSGVTELLLARELDIALVEGPVEDSGILVSAWRTDRMVVVATLHHRLAGRVVEPAALAEELFIMREPGSGTRDVVAAALAEHGIRPSAVLEVGSTETIKQVVAAGLGIAIVSAATVVDQLALGTLVTLDVPGFVVGRTLTRLCLHGRTPSAAAAAFDALLDETSNGSTPLCSPRPI